MNNFAKNIGNITYKEWNQQEILEFEALGSTLDLDIETKKQDIKKKIMQENIALIEEKANNELDDDEFIEICFKAQATGVQLLSNLLFSAEYYFIPALFRDVGTNYIVYGSTNKIMVYEVRKLGKLSKEYIIEYKDIKRYKYKEKKDHTVLYMKVEKDKYGQLRENSNWLLYGYLQNRINMSISSPDRHKIIGYLNNRVKKS